MTPSGNLLIWTWRLSSSRVTPWFFGSMSSGMKLISVSVELGERGCTVGRGGMKVNEASCVGGILNRRRKQEKEDNAVGSVGKCSNSVNDLR
jgi:hypothetical protein